jgi:hypothetical protein
MIHLDQQMLQLTGPMPSCTGSCGRLHPLPITPSRCGTVAGSVDCAGAFLVSNVPFSEQRVLVRLYGVVEPIGITEA